MRIEIADWPKFQHFTDRKPIWIKLYRELLRKREWRQLPPSESKCLVDLWLLASEQPQAGVIDLPIEDIAYELRSEPPEVHCWLLVLQGHRFITLISEGYQADNETIPFARSREVEVQQQLEKELTPPAREIAKAEPDPLATWLGEHATVLDSLPFPVERGPLLQQYGPPGMRAGAWKRPDGTSVPEADRPRLLALALTSYASEGKRAFAANEFAGLLRAAIRAEEPPRPTPQAERAASAAEAATEETKRELARAKKRSDESQAEYQRKAAEGQRLWDAAMRWISGQPNELQVRAKLLVNERMKRDGTYSERPPMFVLGPATAAVAEELGWSPPTKPNATPPTHSQEPSGNLGPSLARYLEPAAQPREPAA